MKTILESTVQLEVEKIKDKVLAKSCSFNLSVDTIKLDKKKYLDENNRPTKLGIHTVSNVLTQGLIGVIHVAHQKGYWDSAKHLRYIISELERGFVENVKVKESVFKKIKQG